MSDKLLDRIGALLAKAESTDSSHEAEALVAKAQQLATSHALDLAAARARQARRDRRTTVEQRTVQVGPKARQGNRHRVLLYVMVAAANDIMVNVAGDNTFVVAYGFPSDLDVTDRLWASLSVQLTATAGARIARGEHRPVDARTWRASFADGFIMVVGRRLQQAREAALAARRAAEPTADGDIVGTDLVVREKTAEVHDFYTSTSKARGTWRGTGTQERQGVRSAYDAGTRDGTRARLGTEQPLPGPRTRLR